LAQFFSDHIAELGNQRPSKPFFFLKPNSSIHPPTRWDAEKQAVVNNTNPIPIPAGVNVHYEVELAVIMFKSIHNFKFAKANMTPDQYESLWQSAILGYAIGMPISPQS